jgi:hypothetical protein
MSLYTCIGGHPISGDRLITPLSDDSMGDAIGVRGFIPATLGLR